MKYLTREELVEKCPPLIKEHPTRNLSDKYVHIPSIKVVDDIIESGWQPVKCSMRGMGKSNFCKHEVTFEKIGAQALISEGDKIIPRVTFVNSHDGLLSFRFYAGLFRFVCSNGLVVPIYIAGKPAGHFLKIRHIYYSLEELKSSLDTILESVAQSVEIVHSLTEIQLSKKQQDLFAKQAFLRRDQVKEDEMNSLLPQVDDSIAKALLEPLRDLDKGDSAWLVLNRVQEKLIKGFNVKTGEKVAKFRAITSFEKLLKTNYELYQDINVIAS